MKIGGALFKEQNMKPSSSAFWAWGPVCLQGHMSMRLALAAPLTDLLYFNIITHVLMYLRNVQT